RHSFPTRRSSDLKIGYGRLTEQMKTYLLNELKHDHTIEITNSSPSNLEINQIGVNKVHAVERLCQLSYISMQEVMAIGDSINDLKMLREVGLGVAVENAQEEILDIASVVTASNNDDGVTKEIKNYALTYKIDVSGDIIISETSIFFTQ